MYCLTKAMFRSLVGKEHQKMRLEVQKVNVIAYINDAFGLCVPITELSFSD